MFCMQCGAKNSDNAKFCRQCGARLAQADAAANSANVLNAPGVVPSAVPAAPTGAAPAVPQTPVASQSSSGLPLPPLPGNVKRTGQAGVPLPSAMPAGVGKTSAATTAQNNKRRAFTLTGITIAIVCAAVIGVLMYAAQQPATPRSAFSDGSVWYQVEVGIDGERYVDRAFTFGQQGNRDTGKVSVCTFFPVAWFTGTRMVDVINGTAHCQNRASYTYELENIRNTPQGADRSDTEVLRLEGSDGTFSLYLFDHAVLAKQFGEKAAGAYPSFTVGGRDFSGFAASDKDALYKDDSDGLGALVTESSDGETYALDPADSLYWHAYYDE